MDSMNRRAFLQAMGVSVAGMGLWGCAPVGGSAIARIREPEDIEPVIDPATLEKPDLNIGFVPVNDCAPFAVAFTQGFFRKYGLRVRLSREASWATSRDGVIFGRLDAAPVVSGAVVNARLGAEGAVPAPICAAMTVHRHGNTITMNRAMWESGVRPLHEYGGDLQRLGEDLRCHMLSLPPDQRVMAVVLSSAIYEYFIRSLMAVGGMVPGRDYRLIVIPPPQMVTNVRIGAMQGYMVAEPWNTRAITGNEGVGFTFAHGSELWRGHPDRLLAVQERFIDRYPKTYRSLVKAMVEACRYCDRAENREAVAELISARAFTGAPARMTRAALTGDYDYGGFDGVSRRRTMPDSTLFFELPEDVKGDTHDQSPFLWHSQGLWLMAQATRWGQVPAFPADADRIVAKAWRADLYRDIVAELGIATPAGNHKLEPGSRFFDGVAFDPSDPVGYLKQFELTTPPRTRSLRRGISI